MTVVYRPMREGEQDAVAAQLRQLAHDLGSPHTPTLTGASLRATSDFVHTMVAEKIGQLVGVCVWMINFSTWRGVKGMYVCDLYVLEHLRGQNIGAHLLRAAAVEAAKLGAAFIKLEVSSDNPRQQAFYNRLGFDLSATDRQMFLEEGPFKSFSMEHSI